MYNFIGDGTIAMIFAIVCISHDEFLPTSFCSRDECIAILSVDLPKRYDAALFALIVTLSVTFALYPTIVNGCGTNISVFDGDVHDGIGDVVTGVGFGTVFVILFYCNFIIFSGGEEVEYVGIGSFVPFSTFWILARIRVCGYIPARLCILLFFFPNV